MLGEKIDEVDDFFRMAASTKMFPKMDKSISGTLRTQFMTTIVSRRVKSFSGLLE